VKNNKPYRRQHQLKPIPKTLKIGPNNWNIIFMKNLSHDEDKFGKTLMLTNTIQIEPELIETRMHEVYWHEVIHAAAEWAGIDLGEDIVLRLGKVMYEILLENGYLYE